MARTRLEDEHEIYECTVIGSKGKKPLVRQPYYDIHYRMLVPRGLGPSIIRRTWPEAELINENTLPLTHMVIAL